MLSVRALSGVRVLEMAGLAPVPFCTQLLADLGASVVRVDKTTPVSTDTLARGKRSISVDLQHRLAPNLIQRLVSSSDVIMDPFRPGVMEKLELGPDGLCKLNPKLIYVRISGYGQTGPMRLKAGHDINYLAMSGVLSRLIDSGGRPFPPVNLLGDFAGGGLLAAFAILASILERNRTGKGRVLDVSMTEGAAYISTFLWQSLSLPIWGNKVGENVLDGGAPFYRCYETADGRFMAVGAIEPKFFISLIEGLQLPEYVDCQMDSTCWPQMREDFCKVLRSKSQDDWVAVFDNRDACVTPVLSFGEAERHGQHTARNAFTQVAPDQFIPSPHGLGFEKTSSDVDSLQSHVTPGRDTRAVLTEFGFSSTEIDALQKDAVIFQAPPSSQL